VLSEAGSTLRGSNSLVAASPAAKSDRRTAVERPAIRAVVTTASPVSCRRNARRWTIAAGSVVGARSLGGGADSILGGGSLADTGSAAGAASGPRGSSSLAVGSAGSAGRWSLTSHGT
jgi:hypothetical protein